MKSPGRVFLPLFVLLAVPAGGCFRSEPAADAPGGGDANESLRSDPRGTTTAREAGETEQLDPSPSPFPSPSPPPHAARVQGPPPIEDELPEGCGQLYAELEELRKRIPIHFNQLRRSANEIDEDVKRAISISEEFLGSCGGSSTLGWVKAHLGRYLLIRHRRVEQELGVKWKKELKRSGLSGRELSIELHAMVDADLQEYRDRIESLGLEALEGSADGSGSRRTALELLADICAKNAEFDRQIGYARQLLREYPGHRHRARFLVDIGDALLFKTEYQEAADFMRDTIAKHKDDREYVNYSSILFDALTGIGDLEGMEKLILRMREEYPERMKISYSNQIESQYEQWFDNSGFWLGFIRFALGDLDAARAAFEDHVTHLDLKERRLAREGEALPQVQQIFREFRTKDHLRFFDGYLGRKPALDLDTGVAWATEKRLSLKESEGKVVAVLFRLPRRLRSKAFFQKLDELCRDLDGVAGVTLGYAGQGASESRVDRLLRGMRSEHEELGIRIAGGYDVTPDSVVFRKLHGTVGPTPSMVVFDRQGRFAWYIRDPRGLDAMLLDRVIRRLAAADG